ncbi:MAG: NAD-dependent deacetylase [Sulfurovum sp. 24-42-9]|nr:MAG: NAD-dependent deacetylase [Sulfurovum sp. 24-42-9]
MKKVLILSGAGISAESGIRTFRDADGMWEEYNVMDVCSVQGFARNPKLVSDFYDARRHDLEDKSPNAAHEMVARIKAKFERAGCDEVIHLHGTLTQLRCEDCGRVFSIGYESQVGVVCPGCESDRIRHNVVMFGEAAPMYEKLQESVEECGMLVVIGTSGQVINVTAIAQWFDHTILNNYDSDPMLDRHFKTRYIEKATTAAAKIEADIEKFLND